MEIDQNLTDLAREFTRKLRGRLTSLAEGEPEVLAERAMGITAAVAAVAVALLPAKKRDGLAAALLSIGLRYLQGRASAVVVDVPPSA